MIERSCYSCGSNKSWVDKNGYEKWHLNHDQENNVLCLKCFDRYILSPIYSKRRYTFKDKQLYTWHGLKTGYCSLCPNNIYDGSCKRTNLHHKYYIIIFPWFSLTELCNSCHNKEDRKIGLKKNKFDGIDKVCFKCKSNTTSFGRKRGYVYPSWHMYNGHLYCNKCFQQEYKMYRR